MTEDVKLTIVKLVSQFDELLPLLMEHLKDYGGEIIPHLFFSDLCRFILEYENSCDLPEKILNKLEVKFNLFQDDPISNAIGVSFIEHLPNKTTHHWIIDKLGYKMKCHYDKVFIVEST